ncbi:MAG: hypothetical protein ACTMIR_10515 [Cellulomonadaceae bacterium]
MHVFEDRLRAVEEDVVGIKAATRPKTAWYVYASGLAGLAAFLAFGIDALGKLL